MTLEEAALRLHGNEYREEGSKELFEEMKAAGLAVVFGGSDDLAELRGAIYDEVGAYSGGKIFLTEKGLLENPCENDECPYHKQVKAKARTIKVLWAPESHPGLSWAYETDIPHAIFDILEDGEVYCRGIVFRLADAAAK